MSERAQETGRDQRYQALDRQRRRRFRRLALLPFAAVTALAIAYLGLALALRSPVQVAVLADTALTLLILCPAVICLFPLMVLSAAAVALMQGWGRASLSPLRRLEGWTAATQRAADRWLGRVDQRVLESAVAIAPIRQLLRAFDTMPMEPEEKDE